MRSIETERLLIRDMLAGDWEAYNHMLSDPETTRYMHFAAWGEEQRRDWFAWCLENSQERAPDVYNWAIVLRDTGQTIGWFGIGSSSHPEVDGQRSFGYLVARPAWNKGYMTEALQALLAYEFYTLGARYISATCDTANPASARVMEKAGMQYLKTVYDADFEGNWAERHHYAITRPQM